MEIGVSANANTSQYQITKSFTHHTNAQCMCVCVCARHQLDLPTSSLIGITRDKLIRMLSQLHSWKYIFLFRYFSFVIIIQIL